MRILIPNQMLPTERYAALTDAGHQLVFGRPLGDRRPFEDGELARLVRDADGVLSTNLPGTAMQGADRLRAVIAQSIGYERIDVEAATSLGVLVCNSPAEENFTGVAEATVGLAMALSKRLKHNEALVRGGGWYTEADLGSVLKGRTYGVVGLGRTGGAVIERLRGWGMRLLACDPYVSPEKAAALGVELVDLPTILGEADCLSLHVPVTDETRNMIGEAELQAMKPTAFLINIARGPVLDEAAFCRAITERWIAGGALDVFVQEPLPHDSPLHGLDPERVILTPHDLAQSPESRAGGFRMSLESMLAALAGRVPEPVVNPEAIPAWRRRFGP